MGAVFAGNNWQLGQLKKNVAQIIEQTYTDLAMSDKHSSQQSQISPSRVLLRGGMATGEESGFVAFGGLGRLGGARPGKARQGGARLGRRGRAGLGGAWPGGAWQGVARQRQQPAPDSEPPF